MRWKIWVNIRPLVGMSNGSRKDVGVNIRKILTDVQFPDVDLLTGWPSKKFAALKRGEEFVFEWNDRTVIVQYDETVQDQYWGSTLLEALIEFDKECQSEGCEENITIYYNRVDLTEFWEIGHWRS